MKIRLKVLLWTFGIGLSLLGGFQYALAQYSNNFWYPDNCTYTSGDCLKPVDPDWGIEVSTITVVDGTTASGTVTIYATSTNPTLTVRQGSTGDILDLLDGNNRVWKFVDGGNLYSPFTASVNLGLGTTTPLARISVAGTSGAHPMILVDARTGFANSLIDLKIASSSKFLINSSGNVGIGSTTPLASLSLNTTAGTNPLAIGSSTGSYLKIDNNGRVGIGTTTPVARLSVSTISQVAPTTQLLTVASTTGATLFKVLGSGLTGIGTSTPFSRLSISTNSQQPPTYKLLTVASTTGTNLFQVLADGTVNFKGATTLSSAGALTTASSVLINGGAASTGGLTIAKVANLAILSSGGTIVFTALTDASRPSLKIMASAGASSFNWVEVDTSLTGAPSIIRSAGNDSSVSLSVGAKSAGNILISTDADSFLGVGTTTPHSVVSISTTAQAAPETKLFTVASTTNTSLFQILANGRATMGSTTPTAYLSINGSAGVDNLKIGSTTGTSFKVNQNGQVFIPKMVSGGLVNTVTILATGQLEQVVSDPYFKDNIRDLDFTCDLSKLRPISFNWNGKSGTPDKEDFGFSALEVAEVCPQLVSYYDEGTMRDGVDIGGTPMSVKYDHLAVLLLNQAQTPATSQKQGSLGYILGGLAVILSLIAIFRRRSI